MRLGLIRTAFLHRGWDVAVVRKSAQCTAFLGASSCLVGATVLQNSYAPLGKPWLSCLGMQDHALGC